MGGGGLLVLLLFNAPLLMQRQSYLSLSFASFQLENGIAKGLKTSLSFASFQPRPRFRDLGRALSFASFQRFPLTPNLKKCYS